MKLNPHLFQLPVHGKSPFQSKGSGGASLQSTNGENAEFAELVEPKPSKSSVVHGLQEPPIFENVPDPERNARIDGDSDEPTKSAPVSDHPEDADKMATITDIEAEMPANLPARWPVATVPKVTVGDLETLAVRDWSWEVPSVGVTQPTLEGSMTVTMPAEQQNSDRPKPDLFMHTVHRLEGKWERPPPPHTDSFAPPNKSNQTEPLFWASTRPKQSNVQPAMAGFTSQTKRSPEVFQNGFNPTVVTIQPAGGMPQIKTATKQALVSPLGEGDGDHSASSALKVLENSIRNQTTRETALPIRSEVMQKTETRASGSDLISPRRNLVAAMPPQLAYKIHPPIQRR